MYLTTTVKRFLQDRCVNHWNKEMPTHARIADSSIFELQEFSESGRSGISPSDVTVLYLVTRGPYQERDWKAALHFPKTFHNPD